MAQPSTAEPLSLLRALGRRFSAPAAAAAAAVGTMSELLPGPGSLPRSPGLVYLITGGSGFLGRHLLRLLLEKEESLMQVRVFDQRPDPSLGDLSTGETPTLVPLHAVLLDPLRLPVGLFFLASLVVLCWFWLVP